MKIQGDFIFKSKTKYDEKKLNSLKEKLLNDKYLNMYSLTMEVLDEEGYEIKNKLGYLKNAVNSNLDKLNNVSTDLYEIDGYDWLNDDVEDDFEL